MDFLQLIKKPIEREMTDFIGLFSKSLGHSDGVLGSALQHIAERGGKRMRPMLIMLVARSFGDVTEETQNAAVSLELLHTSSLIHDDVVDESGERRGQASVNATYGNKVAVLVGDYVVSTALQVAAKSDSNVIVRHLAEVGKTLADGEILQLNNIQCKEPSEEVYYSVISKKTAILFEKCAVLGAQIAGASDDQIEAAREFGHNIGVIFQIRDDIFDYFDSKSIGKPTGNDIREGKLTLPVIHAITTNGNPHVMDLVAKVKSGGISEDEISELIEFTKRSGGIEYAENVMQAYYEKACSFVGKYVLDEEIKTALQAYLDFMIERKY